MTKRQILLLLISIIFINYSVAQSNKDSLKLVWQNNKQPDSIRFKALNKYCTDYMFSEPDSTLLITDFHYQLAQEKKSVEQKMWALNNKANIYRSQRKHFDIAMRLYDEAEELANQLNDPIKKATIQGNKGNVFVVQKKYLKATQYYSAALKTFQEQNDQKGEARMLNNLGGVYLTIGSYDLALEYYEKSLLLFNKRGIEDRKTTLLFMNMGWIYFKQDNYDKAIANYEKALKIVQQKNDKYFVAACYSTLARIHNKAGYLDQASNYAEKSSKIYNALNDAMGILEINLITAKIAFETNIEKAKIQTESILASLPKNADKEIKRDVYDLLYKCYKAEGEMSLSLQMLELQTTYNDSIQLEKNNFAIAREAVKNEFEVKLRENELENEKEKAELELNQLKRTFGVISASALLIACIIFYFRNNSKKNRKKRDALLQELELLKSNSNSNLIIDPNKFKLKRVDIEASIDRKLNDTDWNVLNILLEQPEITNKEIAEKAFMSVDGIGSSLRRMYDYFEIKDSKYKKIALLTDAIKRSKS